MFVCFSFIYFILNLIKSVSHTHTHVQRLTACGCVRATRSYKTKLKTRDITY